MKLFSKNRLFISLLSSSISNAILLSPGYAMDPEVEEDKRAVAPMMHKTVKDLLHPDSYSFAVNLIGSDNPVDNEKGSKVLLEIAQNSSDPNYYAAAKQIFYSGTKQDKKAVAYIIHGFVKNPNNADRYNLAVGLFRCDDPADKEVGRQVLLEITQNRSDPNYRAAVMEIFYNSTEQDKEAVASIIHEFVKQSNNEDSYGLASYLFTSNDLADKEVGRQVLLETAQNSSDPNYYDAIMGIFYNGTPQDKKAVVSIIHEFHYKKLIIEAEEGNEGLFNIVGIAGLFIEVLGEEHLWTQEFIELAAKHANVNVPANPFAVHRHLREQMEQPVKHLPRVFQLGDKRFVTFNLQTLQPRRKSTSIPIKHDELMFFTKQLLTEAEQHPEEFKLNATEALLINPQTAIGEAKTAFFKNLLDTKEEIKDLQKVSLTSFKLRHILMAVKGLYEQERRGIPSQGLTPSSQLILSLLNNVLSCPTGKDDGIDVTYRLLTNRRGASEQELRQERLREEMHEFCKEEMRCIREKLLSGNGPVVRALLNPLKTAEELKAVKIEEAPHQGKYLGNLLGGEIGTFLERKSITFDQNGGCVEPELLKLSRQKVLDTLYQYYTPEIVIGHFHNLFKLHGLTGKIDGKIKTSDVLSELFLDSPDLLENPYYIIYNEFNLPTTLTPLAVAEILIRLNTLAPAGTF